MSTTTPEFEDRLIDDRELARILSISPQTPRAWRHQGRGPAWIRLGGAVRYRMSEVLRFIDERTVRTKS